MAAAAAAAAAPSNTVEDFDRACREAGGRLPCFCYGSNSALQLRQRLHNPYLSPERALVRGYRRVFAGNGARWGGGGVASLVPVRVPAAAMAMAETGGGANHSDGSSDEPETHVLGSVVYLTPLEFGQLDRFEGVPEGSDPFSADSRNVYRRVWVLIETDGKCSSTITTTATAATTTTTTTTTTSAVAGGGTSAEAAAAAAFGIAYVRNKHKWQGFPSDAYLSACARNIAQFWPACVAAGLRVYSCCDGADGDGDGVSLRGVFAGGRAVLDQMEAEIRTSKLHSLRQLLWQNNNNTNRNRNRLPVFCADVKFFDVHTNLARLRGWMSLPLLRARQCVHRQHHRRRSAPSPPYAQRHACSCVRGWMSARGACKHAA